MNGLAQLADAGRLARKMVLASMAYGKEWKLVDDPKFKAGKKVKKKELVNKLRQASSLSPRTDAEKKWKELKRKHIMIIRTRMMRMIRTMMMNRMMSTMMKMTMRIMMNLLMQMVQMIASSQSFRHRSFWKHVLPNHHKYLNCRN